MRQFQNIQHTPPASVLVVEDEYLIRLIAVDVIEEAGFRVYEAGCADEAMRTLEQQRDIGFVFTDINMPGSIDGLELARRIGDRWPEVRVLVTSGGGQKSSMNLPAGGFFIAKPYSPEQVVAKLRAILAEPAAVIH